MLTKEQIEELTQSYRENLEKMNESGQYTGNFYKDFSSVEKKLLENSQEMNAKTLSRLVSSLAKERKKKAVSAVAQDSNL